jgi:hypothetical protein
VFLLFFRNENKEKSEKPLVMTSSSWVPVIRSKEIAQAVNLAFFSVLSFPPATLQTSGSPPLTPAGISGYGSPGDHLHPGGGRRSSPKCQNRRPPRLVGNSASRVREIPARIFLFACPGSPSQKGHPFAALFRRTDTRNGGLPVPLRSGCWDPLFRHEFLP